MKAIISGASRGLGRSVAMAFAKEGFELVLLSRTEKDLKELEAEIKEDVRIAIQPIDLSDSSAIQALDLSWAEDDKLVLVNNVGTFSMEEILEIDRETIHKMMEINLYGSLELTNRLMPYLKKANSAHIFNISSINGLDANSEAPAYSISKHALKAWNDGLREKLRKEGIKVTAFYPGPINTSSWDGMDVDHEAMIQTEDIAELIVQINKMHKGTLIEEVRMTPTNFQP